MHDTSVSPRSPIPAAYIVTMRNGAGSPEAYYVMGSDEQQAIDRAARIAGLKAGQVISISRA